MCGQDGSDNEHTAHHPSCTANQRFLAPELIDTNQKENGRSDYLNGSVDTRGEEGSVRRTEAHSLEDLYFVSQALFHIAGLALPVERSNR